jgi:hypothetical protein
MAQLIGSEDFFQMILIQLGKITGVFLHGSCLEPVLCTAVNQPNKAVEPTAPRAAVWPAGVVHGAAAYCRR